MSIFSKILNLNCYVSELDVFLSNFDQTHPNLSKSQQKERVKYQRIYKLRDHTPKQEEKIITLWEKF